MKEKLERFITFLLDGDDVEIAMSKAGIKSPEDALERLDRIIRVIDDYNRRRKELEKGGGGARDLVLHCDGASKGNPGPASAAAIAYLPSGERLASRGRKIGKATNNVAEYEAVITGLSLAHDLGAVRVVVKLDSELIVNQMNGKYRIRNEALGSLAERVREIEAEFEKCEYIHVPRADNAEADRLANEVLKKKER